MAGATAQGGRIILPPRAPALLEWVHTDGERLATEDASAVIAEKEKR
jgi:hypothetical protein